MFPKNRVDYSKLNTRLEAFVKYFVQDFEAKLLLYHLILEGEIKRAGETSDALAGILGMGLGGVAGGVIGYYVGATIELATTGAQAGKKAAKLMVNKVGNDENIEKAVNLKDLIDAYRIDKNKFRLELVKAGVDVFKSFEMQFMKVDTENGPEYAMKQLAMDASNRALDYYLQKRNDSIAQGVLLGGSKMEPILGIPVFSKIFNTYGLEIIYKGVSHKEKWRTGLLYEKAGVVIEGRNPGEMNYLEKKDGKNETDKYGYRRLLRSENWENLKEGYILCGNLLKNVNFTDYDYILSPKDVEMRSDDLLRKINDDDKGLGEKRLRELIEEMRDGFMKTFRLLREEFEKDFKVLTSIEANLQNLNSDEYIKKISNNLSEEMKVGFQTTQEGQEKIMETMHVMRHKQDVHHEQILKGQKKTHEHLEEIKQNIAQLSKVDKSSPKGPVWFEVKVLVRSFTGRQEQLKQIATGIDKGMFVITGLAGVGKSELALKYAHDNYKDGGSVIWINAETSETAKKSFERLSKNLKIQKDDRDAEEENIKSIIVEICKRFSEGKSLLIFDDAENYSKIEKFLPNNAEKPCVLVTSPDKSGWEAGRMDIQTLSLTGFTEEESIAFIKKSLNIEGDLQDEDIRSLATKLHNFPLALQQAVAYMKDTIKEYQDRNMEYKVRDYLKEYEEKPRKLLNVDLPSDMKARPIPESLEVILDKIKGKEFGQQSLDMLNIISYFAPDNIPENMFQNALAEGNLKNLICITRPLVKYHIVSLKNRMLSVHGLVQQVRRLHLLDKDEEEGTLEKALNLLKEQKKDAKNIHCYSSHITATWNYARKYDKLIEKFIVKEIDDKDAYTSYLNVIAEASSYEVVESIIKTVEDKYPNDLTKVVNAKDKANGIPLHNAALNGDERIMKLLIEKGADVNAKTKQKHRWKPLHLAAKNGFLKVVIALLNKKAYVNDKTGYDFTALHFAARNGYPDIVRALIGKNADVNAEDQHKYTPLHFAVKNNHKQVVDALLEDEKVNVNAETKYKITALHFAAKNGNTYIVKVLLGKHANVNMKNNDKFTPLHYAAVYNHKETVIELLTESDIDVNAETTKGNTPLHFAAEKNSLEIVKGLIERGADVKMKNEDGCTATDLARKGGFTEPENYLSQYEVQKEVSI